MKRKLFATRITPEIIKTLKILAARQEKPCNHMIEEALKDLFKKYGQKVEK